MKANFVSTLLIFFFLAHNMLNGQSPFESDELIKYDVLTHQTDKSIPFNKPFTLLIDKLSAKYVDRIEIHEAKTDKGVRTLKYDEVNEVETSFAFSHTYPFIRLVHELVESKSTYDFEVDFKKNVDSLYIYFPSIKPNSEFDINIVKKLNAIQRKILLTTNVAISNKESWYTKYNNFRKSTIDPQLRRSHLSLDHFDYYLFYYRNIKSYYDDLGKVANYASPTATLSAKTIQSIGKAFKYDKVTFDNLDLIFEINKRNILNLLENGRISIRDAHNYGQDKISDDYDCLQRSLNLKNTLEYIEELNSKLQGVIAQGRTDVYIGGSSISLSVAASELVNLKNNIRQNYSFVSNTLNSINKEIDKDKRLRYGLYLSAETLSSDLKTSGGNILFLDAGISYIGSENLRDEIVHIPKLYWGVSLFFRPINKNTRRKKFPTSKVLRNLEGGDQNIRSRMSIWNNLSLNVGLTLGAINQPDFDSFINGSSLLIGPSYRISRSTKFSAGLALLNRTSKDPRIFEKVIHPGFYASFSADIDFIQGISDITKILLK